MPEMRLRSDGEKKKRSRLRFGSRGGAPFLIFALWQLGVLTFLPSPGKLAESIQATGESITPLDFGLSAWEEDRDAVPSPTVYGDFDGVVVIFEEAMEEATALPEVAAAALAADDIALL